MCSTVCSSTAQCVDGTGGLRANNKVNSVDIVTPTRKLHASFPVHAVSESTWPENDTCGFNEATLNACCNKDTEWMDHTHF